MKYIVMECHMSYAVLLDEEGRFRKAANLHYETGETVTNPMLMQEDERKSLSPARMARRGAAAAAACLLLFLLAGGYYRSYLAPYTSILLAINPSVEMELNRQGTVVGLDGANEDGHRLLEGYSGRGKDKVTVTDELIDRAIDMGFLSEGGTVSFSIDTPDEALFQEYGLELRTEVTRHLEGRMRVVIEITSAQESGTEAPEPVAEPEPVSEPAPPAEPEPEQPQPVSEPVYGDSAYGDSGYGDDGTSDYGTGDDGDSGYGTTDGGDSGYQEAAPVPQEAVQPAAPPAGTSDYGTADGGDSGYGTADDGDSGYDGGDSGYDGGDSGYDG